MHWGDDLGTLGEHIVGDYVYETTGESHYFIITSSGIQAFYAHAYEDRPEFSKSFDMMHRTMELSSGAQRIHIPDLLRAG